MQGPLAFSKLPTTTTGEAVVERYRRYNSPMCAAAQFEAACLGQAKLEISRGQGMRQSLLLTTSLLIASLSSLIAHVATGADAEISFNRDIRPILSANCYHCHGPDSSHREAELRLDTYAGATAFHGDEAAVVPGRVSESLLIGRIESADKDERMPPIDSGLKLSTEQIKLLTRWIANGAKWDEHWAFVRPQRAAQPTVGDSSWCRNPLDYFVLARLEKANLKPNREADRRALIRRVTLDLTGVLPTLEEVDTFVEDASGNAYEKVVNRLLTSPRYGEHRARYWMDYVRYGDTTGIHADAYQSRWPYRDYVISAFNNDKPYDQFTREQLAGDLLPPDDVDQLIATGMVRCGISTGEGGTIIEELRCNLKRERAEMFGAVYMGMTTGCAVCHDHKYDPLTQQDFYSLTAFFNNIAEKASCDDRVDWPPNIHVPIPENRDAYNAVLAKKADVLRRIESRRAKADELISAPQAKRDRPQRVSDEGLELRLRLDENYQGGGHKSRLLHNSAPNAKQPTFTTTGPSPHWGEDTCLWPSFRLETNTLVNLGQTGNFGQGEAFSCGGWIKPRNVPGGKAWNTKQGALVARMDKANGYRGWNLYYMGGPILVQIANEWPKAISIQTVGTTEYRSPFRLPEGSYEGTSPNVTLPRGGWSHVFFTYDGKEKAAGVNIYVNGIKQKVTVSLDALSGSPSTPVPLWLGRRHHGEQMQGTAYQDIRIYRRELTPDEVTRLAREDIAAEIIATKNNPAEWSTDERKVIHDYFFEVVDPVTIALTEKLPALDAELVRLSAGGSLTLVCREKTGVPYADVLHRGAFNARTERVRADVPVFLPPLPGKAPRNRLGLAEWVVSPENPLTARVTVNRVWQELFGTGLVATSEDFGTVGERPSHLDLLDWLAIDFIANDWKIKRLYKTLVMSATYRQSAAATEKTAAMDPQNRLLSHGPRFRMEGEMLRDCALQAGGLLVEKIGGPSVKPYQPTGVWEAGSYGSKNYVQDHDEKLYRRSLYTFWKRMAPMPNLEAFDATDRSAACIRRQRTNTPLAALVLMNDPQYLEAARQFAARAITFGGEADEQRIDYLGRVLLSRPFDSDRMKVLLSALKRFRANLGDDEDRAQSLIAIGESPSMKNVASLTTGKPSTCSHSTRNHPPGLANNGDSSNTDRFWEMDATRGDPAWWQVDLQEPTDLGRVVVVGYYGDSRFYGFTVETSLDGKKWDLVADRRKNKQLSTRSGYTCRFEQRKVRYIRVNQTHNSANPGRHLVEVMAFAESPSTVSAIEQAVWMMMATTVMNSDEAINK